MTAVSVDEPVTGGALRATNFFIGRLLTGEDLQREQRVATARLSRLGRVLGDGVADGLRVSQTPTSTSTRPVVTVTPGLALAPSGLALELPEQTDVALARSRGVAHSEPGGLFADCEPYTASEYSTGSGVYLLTVAPAAAAEGLAPVSGLHRGDPACATAFAVEAVSFRLLRLALPLAELDDRPRLRNRVAYRMFDTAAAADRVRDPFGETTSESLLARLRRTSLSSDEVPLALIGWQAARGISFVDHWAVRRRVTRPDPSDGFGTLVSDRSLAQGEARYLQFQDHVRDLLSTPGTTTMPASQVFTALPPAGFLPVPSAARPGGFHFSDFFRQSTTRGPVHVEGARVAAVLRSSLLCPPLVVGAPEAVWLYAVRENVQAAGAAPPAVRQVLLFAGGHTPYAANAQHDLSYWSFSNLAIRHD